MAKRMRSETEVVVDCDENECLGYSVTEERLSSGETRMVVTLTLTAGAVTLRGRGGGFTRRFTSSDPGAS